MRIVERKKKSLAIIQHINLTEIPSENIKRMVNLANFEEKTLAPLTDSVIIRHLKGKWFRNHWASLTMKKFTKRKFFLDP